MRRRVLVIALVLVVLTGLGLVGRAVWQRVDRTPLQEALGVVDAKALRVSFTDWKQIRAEVDHSPGESAEDWIARGYERDLTAASSIDDAAQAMQDHFGFSPENADWEVFFQNREGAGTVLRMGDGTDFAKIAAKLTDAGFTKPSSAEKVWKGGVDLIPTIDPTLTPEVQYVALLEDDGVVVTSDSFEYAARISDVVRGSHASLASTDAYDMAGHVGSADAAVLWAGDFACEDLSMSTASEDDQQRARQLIADAGEITPVTGVVIALDDDRLTVAEQFPDADQAETNLRSRARLAVGPAVGRTEGAFDEEIELTSSTTSGATMVLRFKARPESSFPLSRHSDGALVFASC